MFDLLVVHIYCFLSSTTKNYFPFPIQIVPLQYLISSLPILSARCLHASIKEKENNLLVSIQFSLKWKILHKVLQTDIPPGDLQVIEVREWPNQVQTLKEWVCGDC